MQRKSQIVPITAIITRAILVTIIIGISIWDRHSIVGIIADSTKSASIFPIIMLAIIMISSLIAFDLLIHRIIALIFAKKIAHELIPNDESRHVT